MNENNKIITVLGTGYVGVTTSAILSNAGYTVYALDISEDRLNALRSGKSFFYEEGLNPLIKKAVDDKTLIPTSSYEEAVSKSSIIFSCVGTPDNPDGSSNLEYVFGAAKESAKFIQPGSVYVQKSTVPVGTGKEVSKIFKDLDVSYTSNPEFLREGTALFDTLFFDRIVVGGNSQQANNQILEIYKTVEQKRSDISKIAGIIGKEISGEYISTGLDSAELIKVTANAFLALKISFANSIAKLADKTDANVVEVMNAVGADPRIGRAFLNAGRGYGGGCFPKDVSGLIMSAEQNGVAMEIMEAASSVNNEMASYIVNNAKAKIGKELQGKKVAVLGLAFKSGTSDSRKSPGIKIANLLVNEGANVNAYDPEANEEASKDLNGGVTIFKSLNECVKDVDAVFITTDWPEFKEADFSKIADLMNGNLIVDCMNCIQISNVVAANLKYLGVGRK